MMSLVEMEIEEDHRLTSSFRIKLSISLLGDGSWNLLDDERLALWKNVLIKVNVGDEEVELIRGYITHIKSQIQVEDDNSYLTLMGLDGSCLMGLEEKVKDWPNKSDSDIATEILQSYSLEAQVDSVEVVHEETVSTIIQRETDIRFLKRLARRNGFDCFVKGDTGYFGKPDFTKSPQPVLASNFGAETNLLSFAAALNALRPTTVQMRQIDTVAKEIVTADIQEGDQKKLGRDGALSLTVPNGNSSKVFVKQALATSQVEMENLCTAVLDEAEWFIQAEGKINTNVYGSVLQTRKLVPIKGVGESFSGLYYVTNVKHVFTHGDYVQNFTARRNALAPEPGDFEGASLLGGLI
jgi:phage protein D